VGHMSRSDNLLRLKVSHDRVSQFDLKISGDATTIDTHDIIVKIASKKY
jgi:hypothetical protein